MSSYAPNDSSDIVILSLDIIEIIDTLYHIVCTIHLGNTSISSRSLPLRVIVGNPGRTVLKVGILITLRRDLAEMTMD